MEAFFTCMKKTCKRIKGYMQDALSFKNITKVYRDETQNFRNDAQNAKNSAETAESRAESAANRAENVVIPTEATYNKQAVDDMYNALLTSIIYNTLQISINKENLNGK